MNAVEELLDQLERLCPCCAGSPARGLMLMPPILIGTAKNGYVLPGKYVPCFYCMATMKARTEVILAKADTLIRAAGRHKLTNLIAPARSAGKGEA